MAIFFRPSDITTRICTVNNKTRGGSAFAVCEDGEQVFISPKIVDATRVEIGDLLTAYCIDNHRQENDGEARYAVRWRAIRITLQERFQPPAVAAPAVPAAPAASPDLGSRIKALLGQDRAWTVVQVIEALGETDHRKVIDWLRTHHDAGRFACAKLYKRGNQERASHVYYAKDIELLIDLIDEVELE